ncbi:MAG: alanine dehydrogenase [Ruminococcaceae bacterium]|nr:alanine dehydrogenase [Oscillospiraceae bacterium]
MIIGVLKEIKPNEFRVAAVPASVKEITSRGHRVLLQTGAGAGSGFTDEEYVAAGAEICQTADEVYTKADIFYKVKEFFPEEYKYMKDDKIIFTYIHSNAHPEETDAILASKVTAIAYEDITDNNGGFPLLKPMSILAGKGGFLAALHHMQSTNQGNGLLLANVCGIDAPVVSIIGAGNSGLGAAELAAGFGNTVRILDVNMAAMEAAKAKLPANVSFMISNRENLVKCLKDSDVIINCIMWPKHRKDHLIYREDLKMMKKGAMIVDVACDDEGAVETCRSTTHDDPVYFEEGIKHYCVDNIPSAFARTASILLSTATLPYLLKIANKGVKGALKEDAHLRRGLTAYNGMLTLEETALKQNRQLTDVEELVKGF